MAFTATMFEPNSIIVAVIATIITSNSIVPWDIDYFLVELVNWVKAFTLEMCASLDS